MSLPGLTVISGNSDSFLQVRQDSETSFRIVKIKCEAEEA